MEETKQNTPSHTPKETTSTDESMDDGVKYQYCVCENLQDTMIFVKDALREYNSMWGYPRVYLMDGRLVHLTEVEDKFGEFVTTVKRVDRGDLALILTAAGRWGKHNRKGVVVETTPPQNVLEAALSAGTGVFDGAVQPLEGIHTGVLLDADYNVIHKKGYNPKTRLFLTHSYDIEAIPDEPTKEDIEAIKKMLWDVFKEFRFADQTGRDSVDYQNTIAALFTAVIRPSWKGTLPIWTVDKTSPRTGGTLLQQVVCALAYGKLPTPQTFPNTASELEKQIKSIIKNHERFGMIDNVPSGDNWVTSTLLTATGGGGDMISFRDFGKLGIIERQLETFFVVNGINLEIERDVCGRVLPTRITSTKAWQEESWTRTKEELCSLAVEKHPAVIRAAAVLHRYWELQGRPKPRSCTGNIAEYSKWYDEVCGMLYCAGYTKLLSNLAEVQTTNNTADTDAAEFIEALAVRFGDRKFSATELVNIISEEVYQMRGGGNEGTFFSLLGEGYAAKARRGELNGKSMGRMLAIDYLDRSFAGCSYRLKKEKNKKTYLYHLENVTSQSSLL